jgi:DNA-binding PadR family transcriptional regulator
MRSAVNAGVLSLVIEQPSYGGEIGRRFEERYDGLLSSRPQHIYKALDELRNQGLVEQIALDDGDRLGQQMRGYRATAKGARAYRGWLRSPIQIGSRARHEVMIRLASTRPEDRETAAFLLDAYERAVLALARRTPVRSDSVIDRLLDEERRTLADAQLRWIARARDELRATPASRQQR